MIFLTGGTGFVGARVAYQWAAGGGRARCLVRDPARAAALGALGFELVRGDVRRPEGFGSALRGCEAVLHLASVLGGGAERMNEVNHLGAVRLAGAARAAGVRRFVHVSSFGARPEGRYPYASSMWNAERAVTDSGLDWIILRPTVVVGPNDPFSAGLIRMARAWPAVVLPDGGRLRVQPIWVEDLARALLMCVGGSDLSGRIVPVAGPEALSLREMARAFMRALGVDKPVVSLDRRLLKRALPLWRRLGGTPPWVAGHLLSRDHVLPAWDAGVFERRFGFPPRPFSELAPELTRP
jgi:NADH dehydrogenase